MQGGGAGKSGSGPLTALDLSWTGTICVGAELIDAEARPTKATSSAKARMASFIFSNLSEFDLGGMHPLIHIESYPIC